MVLPPTHQRPRRSRKALILSALLLGGLGITAYLLQKRPASGTSQIDTTFTVPPAPFVMPTKVPDDPNERQALQDLYRRSVYADGRKIDRSTKIESSGLNYGHQLELALDEVFVGSEAGMSVERINDIENRHQLEKFVARETAARQAAVLPVFYMKGVPHRPGTRSVLTAEIVTALKPGVSSAEIERDYDLAPSPTGSGVGLTRFIAKTAFATLDLVQKLRQDVRLSVVDHELMKSVAPKAVVPSDPLLSAQWHISATSNPPENFNLDLFPALLPPVWGDFAIPDDGIRGRNVRVGIVDDGIDLDHPDLTDNLALSSEQHAYDMTWPLASDSNPYPMPRILSKSDRDAIHQRTANRAHGTAMAGLIGAVANNSIGMAGIAPSAKLVGIRALSNIYNQNNPTGLTQYPTIANSYIIPGDYVTPTMDVILAASYAYLQNDGEGYIYTTNRLLYEGTVYEKRLAPFSDLAAGSMIHIKNCSFGAPDAGIYDGPGPELGGVVVNNIYREGAINVAAKTGRKGFGSIIVGPAGNGRFNGVENSNQDGFVNKREVITVGALARMLPQHQGLTASDANTTYSEPGANLLVSAPGAGRYWSNKNARTYNRNPQTGTDSVFNVNPFVNTLDWSIDVSGSATSKPITVDCYGYNSGRAATSPGEIGNKDYTQTFQGTSASTAMVSGVVALMLEANPRLSWLDVQDKLIRTARNHVIRTYRPDGTFTEAPNPLGVDPADPNDVVTIDRDWKLNSGNVWFNHKYGAGLADARLAVDSAIDGVLLPAPADFVAIEAKTPLIIQPPLNPTTATVTTTTTITPSSLPQNFVLTHVTLKFDYIEIPDVGDLGITLKAPGGMESILAEPHYDGSPNLTDFTFLSNRHWGEMPGGNAWTLTITDYFAQNVGPAQRNFIVNAPYPAGQTGPTRNVTLTLYGYVKPGIPVINTPVSAASATPTVITAFRGKPFSYSMAAEGAGNLPTMWTVRKWPLDPTNPPPFPPGLGLATLTLDDGTYLPTRVITGSATTLGTFDMQVVARNVAGNSTPKFLRINVVEPPDAYTQWAQFFFGANAATDPNALGSADPDGDGYTNVAEYGLGRLPKTPDGTPATTFVQDGTGKWTIAFRRFLTRDMTYELQLSSDLATWTTVASSTTNAATVVQPGYTVTESAIANDNASGPAGLTSYRTVTVTSNPNAPAPAYYRLKLTPPRNPLNPS